MKWTFGKFVIYSGAVCALGSCASVETKLPVPNAAMLSEETRMQESRAFENYLGMSKRLDRVSSSVLMANADLCAKTRTDLGLTTHSVKSYPKALRAGAKRWLGAADEPRVFLVRGNGPAAGKIVPGAKLRGPKGDGLAAGSAFFKKKIAAGDGIEAESPDGNIINYNPPKTRICDYKVKLKFSGTVNAYATGKTIIVTTGMMGFVENDDELALVVGHELAHNTLRHVRKGIQNTILSGFATRYTRPFEAEADYVGLYYMARAGYETQGVELFWRRLGTAHPKSVVKAKTHPVTPSRLLSIRMSAAEINAKRAANLPLVPNYIKGDTIKASDDN